MLAKILNSQYTKRTKHPFIDCTISDDIITWYFKIKNLDGDYNGGEYIFTLTAPHDFPVSPPVFKFCTPNGLFAVDVPICISIGVLHANDSPGKNGSYGWRPCLGMMGFAEQVLNAFICFTEADTGIGIEHKSSDEKRELARLSKSFNEKMKLSW